jgi:hypothetical protein
MFITKKHLPRRTFLRGVGVTLGLLDSMLPAQTALRKTAAMPSPRVRLYSARRRDGQVDA